MLAALPAAGSCGSAPAGHQMFLPQGLSTFCMSATVNTMAARTGMA